MFSKKTIQFGMTSMLVASFLVSSIFSTTTVFAKDRINLYNGQKINAKVTSVIGDIIEYRTGYGKRGHLSRLQLVNRMDVVKTGAGELYSGEVIYMDSSTIDIRTPQGLRQLTRLWVKDIVLGQPKNDYQTGFIESPHQLVKDKQHLHMGVNPQRPQPQPEPCVPCEEQ